MRIAVIVPNAPHLKTEQLVIRLGSRNVHEASIVTVPFVARKPRTSNFEHRPKQSDSVPLDELAKGMNLDVLHTKNIEEFDPRTVNICIVTGSVLLPDEFIDRADGKIINCHPGLIPETRGLDSFKWAILDERCVGNTLHYIDSRIDLGRVLTRRVTPVFSSDTLNTFARRHYEAELNLLTYFDDFLHCPAQDAAELGTVGVVHRRMDAQREKELKPAFEIYKSRNAFDVKVTS